jgi:predicted alpha/beta-hydrolase family hydrolase
VKRGRFSFAVGAGRTTALVYPAAKTKRADGATLVLAHGAGAPQTHPFLVAAATAIAARGIEVVTFNFLYLEGKRGGLDRPAVLEATWLAAIAAVRKRRRPARLFIGGKSMGGRFATMVAARDDVDVAGLVLLGYPLHPPGKPDKLRTEHLPRVRAPMLFVQGSRDAFGTPAELAPVVRKLAKGTRLFVVEGGDHSLTLARKAGVTLDQTLARVADEVAAFVSA